MASVDLTSVTLARILFAAFLILGVILLVNMLIALLSNTYQKTEENSIREWSFKRAVTIHTYDGYDPIPVPLNIIYSIFIILRKLFKKDDRTHCDCENRCIEESHCQCFVSSLKCHDLCACNQGYCNNVFTHIDILERLLGEDYFKTHEDIFPIADDTEVKVDDIQKNVKDVQTKVEDIQIRVKDIEHSRQIMSGIHITTFLSQFGDQGKLCTSQTAWHCHPGIRIEGPLLTFKCSIPEEDLRGARYRNCFSPEFPHFEVVIIETGERRFLGIGIVDEGYNTKEMPGWYKESVGYHTDDGKIFPNQGFGGKKTEGPTADSGDRIRCTVMFEEKRERDGKVQVPVFFTLNGKKMIVKKRDEDEDKDETERSHFYMDWDLYYKPLFPYICMTFGGIVLAKMCAKEDDEHHSPELQEKKADPADDAHSETGALKENSPQLEEIKADLVDVGKQLIYAREDVVRQSLHIQDVKSDLAAVREDMCSKEDVSREVKKATRCLEEKLDALLARLGEKE